MIITKRSRLAISFILILLIVTYLSVILFQRSEQKQKKLAQTYCGSCHQMPSPDILDKQSWNFLLSYMGFFFGKRDYNLIADSSLVVIRNLRSKEYVLRTYGLIPQDNVMSDERWHEIRDYFISRAPISPLPQKTKSKIKEGLSHFELHYPSYQPKEAVITMVKIVDSGGILIANAQNSSLNYLDRALNLDQSSFGFPLIVSAAKQNEKLLLLSIGDLMGSSVNIPKGHIIKSNNSQGNLENEGNVISNLRRPAHMIFADLDTNGVDELVISNFGDMVGSLDIFIQDSGKWKKNSSIINRSGALISKVHDFNKDGLPDIMTLFGQENENLSIFYNLGNLRFEPQIVVQMHAAYGHTFFELNDFNNDGYMDILAVNGDSDADPYNTLKNYHGLRIYINNQLNQFEESYFYPMYGMHFAKAADFDMDGDLDIAASAFFPDFSLENPEQFVYLKNNGNLSFQPFTHPSTYDGRWMVLDVGDYDLDGDEDIILGAGNLPMGMVVKYKDKLEKLMNSGKAVIVFENTTIR